MFEQAIADLSQREAIVPVLERMRRYKSRVGRLMFVPELLRKMVDYNLTVWNRLDEVIGADRVVHKAERNATPPKRSPSRKESAPASSKVPVREKPAGKPMREIERALRRRLIGEQGGRGRAADLVRALDLSAVNDWEREAFSDVSYESESELVRTVVTLGLLLRQASRVEDSEMGLVLRDVEGESVSRLDERVQQRIARAIAANDYPMAKQLAELKAKYLYPSLEARRRSEAQRTAAPRGAPGAKARSARRRSGKR